MVDSAFNFRLLSFMDAYSGYNQIPIHACNEEKTAFIILMTNYYYKGMSFGLKNAGSTYLCLMDKIFGEHIRKLLKVYNDDMLVKTSEYQI